MMTCKSTACRILRGSEGKILSKEISQPFPEDVNDTQIQYPEFLGNKVDNWSTSCLHRCMVVKHVVLY